MKEDEGGIYSKGPDWKAFSFCLRYTGKNETLVNKFALFQIQLGGLGAAQLKENFEIFNLI